MTTSIVTRQILPELSRRLGEADVGYHVVRTEPFAIPGYINDDYMPHDYSCLGKTAVIVTRVQKDKVFFTRRSWQLDEQWYSNDGKWARVTEVFDHLRKGAKPTLAAIEDVTLRADEVFKGIRFTREALGNMSMGGYECIGSTGFLTVSGPSGHPVVFDDDEDEDDVYQTTLDALLKYPRGTRG